MKIQELIKKYERLVGTSVFPLVGIDTILEDLNQLDEPQKVTVPQFVADYIKDAKYYEWDLDDVFNHIAEESEESEIYKWFYTLGNVEVFARAWLDGYEVEKEKRYLVKLKGINSESEYLYYGNGSCTWRFREKNESGYFRKEHTRKELEEAGFGEVFHSSLFEVEEV